MQCNRPRHELHLYMIKRSWDQTPVLQHVTLLTRVQDLGNWYCNTSCNTMNIYVLQNSSPKNSKAWEQSKQSHHPSSVCANIPT
jgi:hypothetical protein